MKWLFWASVALVAYAYFGYAAWLWLWTRLRSLPVRRAPFFPRVSLVMVVRNEEQVLPAKLRNLASCEYPPQLMEFIVVSDHSDDGSESILAQACAHDGRFRFFPASGQGKASGLNEAIRAATGDVVVFTDARQHIEVAGIGLLMQNFADSAVGCASGELMLGDFQQGEQSTGMGLYWQLEKKIREMESACGAVVGATGAFYAARRELLVELPVQTILDDVYLPMAVVKAGSRVVFDTRARAWDTPNLGGKREFARKVRTLTGNYQLLQLAPWLLTGVNPIRFEFVSHKLVRLLVPFAMALALGTSIFLPGTFYRLALGCQVVFYASSLLAVMGLNRGPLRRVGDAALTVLLLNTAALVAFSNFVTRRKVAWAR